jgi:hypothetical protein
MQATFVVCRDICHSNRPGADMPGGDEIEETEMSVTRYDGKISWSGDDPNPTVTIDILKMAYYTRCEQALKDILALSPASLAVDYDYADHDCSRCLEMQKIARKALKGETK